MSARVRVSEDPFANLKLNQRCKQIGTLISLKLSASNAFSYLIFLNGSAHLVIEQETKNDLLLLCQHLDVFSVMPLKVERHPADKSKQFV